MGDKNEFATFDLDALLKALTDGGHIALTVKGQPVGKINLRDILDEIDMYMDGCTHYSPGDESYRLTFTGYASVSTGLRKDRGSDG